jgi:uncharacterized iron-regulated protein
MSLSRLGLGPVALGAALLAIVPWSGSASQPAAEPSRSETGEADPATWVLDLNNLGRLDGLIKKLAGRQLVFVGETHDRYDHHLNQLAIIEGLYERHPDLAIGVEYFPQASQPYLDQFIAGTLDEKQFLKKSEYFSRWSFDYRLYRPIFRFARERHIQIGRAHV